MMCPPAQFAMQLDCNTATTLDVVKDLNLYCKVSVQIYKAPGVLQIQYCQPDDKLDVYYSNKP